MFLLLILGQTLTHTPGGNILITNIPRVENISVPQRSIRTTKYDGIIRYYCQQYGIDEELIKIIIEKESQFNPRAVSRSGAIGLMQLMPGTAKILGVKNPFNPRENIKGGIKYLSQLFNMFGGNLELTLAAYHAGPKTVKKFNRVPAIPETMEYIDYIISRYGPAQKRIPIHLSFTKEGTPFFTNLPK